MRTIILGVMLVVAGLASAAEYNFSWSGDTFRNGMTLAVPGFFAGPLGEQNRGVHLFACDDADWDSATVHVDMGEILQAGADGVVTVEIGDLVSRPTVHAFFVRGEDHLVHAPHPIQLAPGQPGQPVNE
ncbi:MAG TPA: hypothetical protein PLQ13_03165 [Candidatus Krumholzibacteria bacterium]|nr:hypothetical protein [Candidatus Krumholzibacteria bacterium]